MNLDSVQFHRIQNKKDRFQKKPFSSKKTGMKVLRQNLNESTELLRHAATLSGSILALHNLSTLNHLSG